MRIALFSDIHANLPALEAMFESMDQQKPDAIYCLGDLVGYNAWPNEVVNAIRRRGIPTIAGNYDDGVGRASDDCGCAYKTDKDKAMGKLSIDFTNRTIGESERIFLRTLPSQIRIDFKWNNENLSMLLVHGSPRKINEYLFEDRSESSLQRILEDAEADILCFGHTHIPYHRVLERSDGGIRRYRHAINIGSVGKPKDGDPRGCYAILTLGDASSSNTKDSISVKLVRFTYDVARAQKGVIQSSLPLEFAEMLGGAY